MASLLMMMVDGKTKELQELIGRLRLTFRPPVLGHGHSDILVAAHEDYPLVERSRQQSACLECSEMEERQDHNGQVRQEGCLAVSIGATPVDKAVYTLCR